MQAFLLESPAFVSGAPLPIDYTREGANLSPPLRWKNPPAGTTHLALICSDPDAPGGTWIHWVLYNIPVQWAELPERFPRLRSMSGTNQGVNSYRTLGYDGPFPPKGQNHRYFFKLYALSRPLKLAAGIPAAQVEQAMQPVLLGNTELIGTYQRST
ncbi:YbhB/YbcL family Raf kinase inhibitor-like protein [bacterium (Candidatus Blackallbacteria) CG17_big_fil_post_rev_8_21_14_2_50_48_46]|uniref:YbhB/YbcL family Raf kinase inhibitor-like protein n=1 Tax=bacterium (Candidatus Blackallbacteria) CG17_big_fil_post_rev_8_21_14_2_50_48_46 TaxID=2014261 RepID=A0A2M7G938_9BACT|nr:MAG: YbhB/YbcL family Raf kinase inhibitor-like protein [bacterium (Candidatus Blackallbacteria) CG18_big_fil_WC_8_21_14_2_50_49_26]PIW18629.1 MAG: YbhB/YbcL family Raf kinase inhibitor-like protein [bacterium (Candidatus Blackallbacteria) CG17_big_fil_post_rev_8_21_14_2_50_48_46]PIW46385.1 MAG: YbhB/YbcL family Raf kinase inhibitor-like protein [bacterium (Candidatus Blackallbacteria) CG13_big_fil_rev_8_21_14_2_50_49_14]